MFGFKLKAENKKGVEMELNIPITFMVTHKEVDKFGFTAEEQIRNNPRVRNMLKKVL